MNQSGPQNPAPLVLLVAAAGLVAVVSNAPRWGQSLL